MELTFVPNGVVQIDGARLCFRNFKGEGSMYNNEGDRNFAIVIPDETIAEALLNDTNEMGASWNVKIKAPREEGDEPFRYLPVKVKYTERSQPKVYLVSGKNRRELDEHTIGLLDEISIASADIDIRPYDSESRFGAHRTAYLQAIRVHQNMNFDRFAAEDEYPRED